MTDVMAILAGGMAAVGAGLALALGIFPRPMRRDPSKLPGQEEKVCLFLRDAEWALAGDVDLLRTPQEWTPVVEEKVGSASVPLEPTDSTLVRIGAAFILCDADPQIGHRPLEGRIRYLDEAGRLLPDGEFRIWNTPLLRQYVLERVVAMRQHLGCGEPPARPTDCATCELYRQCGAAAAGFAG